MSYGLTVAHASLVRTFMTARSPTRLLPLAMSRPTAGKEPRPRPEFSARSLSLCVSAEALALIPFEVARRLCVLPLGVIGRSRGAVVSIAVPAETHAESTQQVKVLLGCEVRSCAVPSTVLREALSLAYRRSGSELEGAAESLRRIDLPTESPDSAPFLSPTGEVAQFLAELIQFALARDASDIHVIPGPQGTKISLRIQGELMSREAPICAPEVHPQLIRRLKVLARLDTSTVPLPLDGTLTISASSEEKLYARMSTVPTVFGEKAVLRLLRGSEVLPLSELGFDSTILPLFERFFAQEEGALLLAGPTGSGKSTTLYSAATELARAGNIVCTAEDPVERQLPELTQISILPQQGLTYPVALRSILRQDPDAILIGEIRDAESASIALQAALTGHSLMASLHARNVSEVLMRLTLLGLDTLTVAQSVRLILVQRLAPLLCHCKQLDALHGEETGQTYFRRNGCSACGFTGYVGRSVVGEALWIDERSAPDLVRAKDCREFLQEAADRGEYITFAPQIQKLLQNGKIEARHYLHFLHQK